MCLAFEYWFRVIVFYNFFLIIKYIFLFSLILLCTAYANIVCLMQFLSEVSMLDCDPFLRYLPSLIAASAVALANHTLVLPCRSLLNLKLLKTCMNYGICVRMKYRKPAWIMKCVRMKCRRVLHCRWWRDSISFCIFLATVVGIQMIVLFRHLIMLRSHPFLSIFTAISRTFYKIIRFCSI